MTAFSKRMDNIKASDIRQLLKIIGQPGIISFAGGLPAPELFPVEDFKAALDAVMDENGRVALQYGATEGWKPLRDHIVKRLAAKNDIHTDADHVLLTAGSQQGLDFLGKLYLDPGDVVVVESPSYLGAINAFKQYECKFVEVPTDENGMIMSELDRILATTENVKLIYKYHVTAIEDNPYGDLRFKGEYLPALKSMDPEENIVYFGTFSKILAPGLRIGWTVANATITEKLNLIAQAAVLQTSTINAMAIAKYLDMFDIDEHVATILPVYKHRCELMIQTMRETFPEGVTFTDPDGGLFTWVELPEHINSRKLAEACLEKGVAVVPGDGFFPNGENKRCFRMNYSNATDEQLILGVHRLAETIREFM